MKLWVTDYIYTINGRRYAGEYIKGETKEEAEEEIKERGLPLKIVGELVEEIPLYLPQIDQ